MVKSRKVPLPYQSYRQQTLRPLNCLIFIAPLLVAFHFGLARFGTDLMVPHYFHVVLRYFGATGVHLPAVLIAVVLVAQHFLRRDKWRIEPRVLAGMFAESMLWTAPLIALTFLMPVVAAQATTGPATGNLLKNVVEAIGAGIYEEFFFRLVLISTILLIFVDLCSLPKRIAGPVALIVVAVAFSLCHGLSQQLAGAEPLTRNHYVFFFLAGALWGVVFVFRGLGIAVGSHIFYNLYVLGVAQ